MARRPLRGVHSLKRTVQPHQPKPVQPADWATVERPIGMCRKCGHHTSAYCGACTAFVMDARYFPAWCGCDCRAYLDGENDD